MKASRKASSRQVPPPKTLIFYEVCDDGTLSDPGVPKLKVRADVFQNLSPQWIRTKDELVCAVEGCARLACHFSNLAADHLSSIEDDLGADDHPLGFVERRRLVFLAAALRHDPDTGWRVWVEHEGDPGLAGFKETIQNWLDEDIDWDEAESFDSGWSGQDSALRFFSDLAAKVLDALGVVITMGEHPGSSYYAAELKNTIANANQVACKLSLPFRFRAESQRVVALKRAGV